MKSIELNPRQTQLLRHFHVIMESEGWDDEKGIEALQLAGEATIPEAERVWAGNSVVITAQVHIPLNMIRVLVDNKITGERNLWLFFYRFQTDGLIAWISANAPIFAENDLNLIIASLLTQTDAILYQDADTELYEIKARKGAGRPFAIEPLSTDPHTDTPIHA